MRLSAKEREVVAGANSDASESLPDPVAIECRQCGAEAVLNAEGLPPRGWELELPPCPMPVQYVCGTCVENGP
jgi:hypothetical protein